MARLEVLIEVPEVLRITRSDALNLTLYTWATDRDPNPKTKQAAADGWVLHGYYNAYSIRFPILEMVTQENLRGGILEAFKEIDKRLQKISDQIKEVI